MTKQSDLLNQLKIDRTEPAPASGVSWGVTIVIALIALTLGGFSSLQFFGATSTNEPVSEKMQAKPIIKPTPNEEKTISVPAETVAPAAQDEQILNASGYITARRTATVSSQAFGLITDVRVEEGMSVEKGQILALLDDKVAAVDLKFAQAQVRVAEALLGSSKANLDEAERVLVRVSELKTADFSSEASVTKAQANVDSLTAEYTRAHANIDVAKLEAKRQQERHSYFTIKAPFSGVVTVKNAQPGEIVSPSSAGGGFTRTGICTIVDMTSLEIEVDVNEAFIGRVFKGQRVEANLDAYPDWKISAAVIAVIPTADRAKATVKVRIGIDKLDSRILPDMGVKVAFLKG